MSYSPLVAPMSGLGKMEGELLLLLLCSGLKGVGGVGVAAAAALVVQ
jgi:hypothetical protein